MTEHPGGPTEVVEAFFERFQPLDRHRLDDGWRELPVNRVFEADDGKIAWRDNRDLANATATHDAGAA